MTRARGQAVLITHLVISDNVALGVSGPVLAEVCVVVVIMDPVLEAEGVRLLVLAVAVAGGHVGGDGGGVGGAH